MPIVGLNDLKNKGGQEGALPSSHSSAGGSNEHNELYTGGATSGLAVVGGPSQATNAQLPHNQRILRLAKRSKRKESDTESSQLTTVITLYRNGFVVGDGPFRAKDDPANQRFLKELAAGNCPRELETGIHGGAMNVELKDKHTEDFIPPAYTAFGGSGHSLSSPTNATASSAPGSSTALVPKKILLDATAPTARVQLQLHDRRRVVVTCNLSTTVQELMQHAAVETPDLNGRFTLLQGYPPKPISPEAMGQTVEEAKLNGAKLTQRKL